MKFNGEVCLDIIRLKEGASFNKGDVKFTLLSRFHKGNTIAYTYIFSCDDKVYQLTDSYSHNDYDGTPCFASDYWTKDKEISVIEVKKIMITKWVEI